jgi:uncharacterized repeat protein (TIGR01451 family)
MSHKNKLLASAGGVLAVLGVTPAFAAGTTSGTTINNTATVNYQVGGVAQTPVVSNTASFVVDRRVNLVVAEIGNVTTSVAPGSTQQVLSFTVTNTTNGALDLGLLATQQAGGAATHGSVDNFDATAPVIYLDNAVTGTVGSFDAGDTVVTYLDEIAADVTRTVFIVSSIPVGRANGDIANISLTAQAREPGVAGTPGVVVAQTAGANTAGVDTVFADAAGVIDAARDGQSSDDDDYTVSAPVLTVSKQSRVISDPVNGVSANAKLIPGAVVEYCIVVANGAGGASATNVAVSDPIPANTTFVTGSSFLNGSYVGTAPTGTCTLDGTAGGTLAAGTLSGTLGTIAASTTRTLYFQVTVN